MQGADVLIGNVRQMVRGGCLQVGGQGRPAGMGQLFGMDPEPQARFPGRLEDRPRFVRGIDPRLAEDVAKFGQALFRHRGDHPIHQMPDVGFPILAVLPGHLGRP